MKTSHLLPLLLVTLIAGCRTSKEAQLEAIGRDWAKVIRASQVIPVYPLTEDLHPGDVFLVQTPVDRQQEMWDDQGYLPLDNHLVRLHPEGYAKFYEKGFLQGGTNTTLPGDWLRPANTNQSAWQAAPRVAFPTYGFSVRSGVGMNLAVPVQGVPVGLSLMGTDAASGTISIRDAFTLGVDTVSLYEQLKAWAQEHAALLHAYEPAKDEPRPRNYLRAVTRIYAAGQLEIGLADTSTRAAGADVGVPKPVNLLYADLPTDPTNTSAATLSNYTNNLNQLNAGLSAVAEAAKAAGTLLPGGSLRVNAASSRYISMSEAFPRPLVIGYLAFDCAVLRGGVLGPPVATFASLEGRLDLAGTFGNEPVSRIYEDALVFDLYQLLKPGDPARTALDALEAFVPPGWTPYQFDPDTNLLETTDSSVPARGARSGYERYRSYRGERQTTRGAIRDALAVDRFELVEASAAPVTIDRTSPLRARLDAMEASAEPGSLELAAVAQAEDQLIRQFLQQLAY